MTLKYVSVFDLLKVDQTKELVKSGDLESLKIFLYEVGFDVDRDFEVQECYHRTVLGGNEVFYGIRFCSSERRDDVWMASEHCTFENKLEVIGIKDLAFQKELVAMGATPNYTAMFIDHIRQSSKKKNNKAGE